MQTATTSRKGQDAYQAPLLALEFLTILRLRRPPLPETEVLGKSLAFFPAVGLLLGGVLAGIDRAVLDSLGPGITGWLLMSLLLLLTGALHADGLADTADGVFGASTPERRLAVMRDSSIGAFGAAALVAVLGLKAAALGGLSGGSRIEALIVVPALARWACVVAIAAFPYARAQGLGSAFRANARSWPAPVAGAIALVACFVGLGFEGLALWALSTLAALLLGALITSRIGGMTGDAYGAVVEVSEALLFVVAVAWLS